MKILEAQSALLTNYEVHDHLMEQRARYSKPGRRRRGPGNLETLVRELITHLETYPGPLSQKPSPYTPDSISELLRRLRPFDITKGEMVMILNLRPTSPAALNTIVEDMADRFSEDDQQVIVDVITDVLGSFPPAEEADEEEEPTNGEADGDGSHMDTTAG